MANYFVRMSGNDSNAGTSASTAWRTIQKALSASGISSGDTVYIGAGVYREVVTIAMTSATAETQVIGDFDGSQTGDAGEIQWTSYITNDETLPSASNLLNLNGRDFLTFKNISFVSNTPTILATTTTSTDISFIDCKSINISNNHIVLTVGFGISANWKITGCVFIHSSAGNSVINITLTTGVGSDYDSNILIKDSICTGFGTFVLITSSGSSVNEGGGVKIINCTGVGMAAFVQTSTLRIGGQLFNYPVMVYNCLIWAQRGGTATIIAGELGALIENYNIIYGTTARSNVNIGPQSVADSSVSPLISLGDEIKFGKAPKPFFSPTKNSPLLGHGDRTLAFPNDFLGNPRPVGINNLVAKGTVSSATNLSLSDSSQNFGSSGNLNGYNIKIIDGLGKGQSKVIQANTSTSLSGDGAWLITPDSTSQYIVFQGQTSSTGPVSGATSNTIKVSGAQWGNNFWQGYTCMITSGVSAGQNFIVSGNDSSTLTGYYSMGVTPSGNDAYALFWGAILSGTVSTGTNITLTDNSANWAGSISGSGGFWSNWRCMIVSGVASGANFVVSGNSSNTLSGWNTFAITPVSGDKYVVYSNTGNLTGYYSSGYIPPYSTNFTQCSAGCFEFNNTAIRETGIVLNGANSIRIFGAGIQDFDLPVTTSVINTVSIWGYYDAYYTGVNPQLIVKNGARCGVSDNTGTMLGNTGQWEKISLSFTPNRNGILTVRLQSNSSGIGGSAYFDTLTVV